MSRFAGVKYKVVERIMLNNGWRKIRKSGSHETWAKDSGRITIANRPDGVNQMILRREFKTHNIWPLPR